MARNFLGLFWENALMAADVAVVGYLCQSGSYGCQSGCWRGGIWEPGGTKRDRPRMAKFLATKGLGRSTCHAQKEKAHRRFIAGAPWLRETRAGGGKETSKPSACRRAPPHCQIAIAEVGAVHSLAPAEPVAQARAQHIVPGVSPSMSTREVVVRS